MHFNVVDESYSLYSHQHQKGIAYMSVKVFNRLPINIKKEFDNSKKFRHSLKNFLKEESFYSLQEYFEL